MAREDPVDVFGLLRDLAAIREAVWIVGYEGGLVSENVPEGLRPPTMEGASITVNDRKYRRRRRLRLLSAQRFACGTFVTPFIRVVGTSLMSCSMVQGFACQISCGRRISSGRPMFDPAAWKTCPLISFANSVHR